MKKIILNLKEVEGVTRRVLSAEVQRRLLAMGYKSRNSRETIRCLESEVLMVWAFHKEPMVDFLVQLSFGFVGECQMADHPIFNAKDELDEFLKLARGGMTDFLSAPIERVIGGCDVTITPDDIIIDTTRLVCGVEAEAKNIQASHFGRVKEEDVAF
jgi:hypothetical protein